MASKEELFGEVASTISEMFGISLARITPGMRLVEELAIDSIDAIDMAVRLEKRVGFEFKGSDLRALKTIQDVVDLLWNSQTALASAPLDASAAGRE